MKFRLIVVGVSVVLVTLILSSAVYAPLATLGTGYAVTSNYEGVDVPAGAEVIITALTIDPVWIGLLSDGMNLQTEMGLWLGK